MRPHLHLCSLIWVGSKVDLGTLVDSSGLVDAVRRLAEDMLLLLRGCLGTGTKSGLASGSPALQAAPRILLKDAPEVGVEIDGKWWSSFRW